MEDPRLAWLLSCAAKLANGQDISRPFQVRKLLRTLGIPLEKRISATAKHGSGVLELRPPATHSIVIYRQDDTAVLLSRRERFTIAHEVAHLLLIRKYAWNPTSGKEYFLCEDYCDRFAGELLFPRILVENVQFSRALDVLEYLRTAYVRKNVSYEVIARQLQKRLNHVAVFSGRLCQNKAGSNVVSVDWGCSCIVDVRIRSKQHLTDMHPLGELLLVGWNRFRSGKPQVFDGSFGEVAGIRLIRDGSRALLCVLARGMSS